MLCPPLLNLLLYALFEVVGSCSIAKYTNTCLNWSCCLFIVMLSLSFLIYSKLKSLLHVISFIVDLCSFEIVVTCYLFHSWLFLFEVDVTCYLYYCWTTLTWIRYYLLCLLLLSLSFYFIVLLYFLCWFTCCTLVLLFFSLYLVFLIHGLCVVIVLELLLWKRCGIWAHIITTRPIVLSSSASFDGLRPWVSSLYVLWLVRIVEFEFRKVRSWFGRKILKSEDLSWRSWSKFEFWVNGLKIRIWRFQ